MICVRHRSASGDLSNCWEYDASERRVNVTVRLGGQEASFSVAICSRDRPVLGAHPILRLTEVSWRVPPERYIRTWRERVERLETIRCPLSDLVGYFAVAITNAPPDVAKLLEAL